MNKNELMVWDAASELSKVQTIRAAIDRVRYNSRVIRMSLWQSIKYFFIHKTYRWVRSRTVLDPVFPWQRGYESAHYEASFIYQRKDRL